MRNLSTFLGIFNDKDANGEVLFDLSSAIETKDNKIIPWELFLLQEETP